MAGQQYQAQPQQGYSGQGFGPAGGGPASGGAAAVGSPPPEKKRSKLGLLLGGAAAIGLIGGGLVFVATRDSGDEVEATSPSTSVVEDDSADSPVDGTDDPESEPVEAGPLGAEELARSVVQIQLLLEGQPTCTGSGTIIDDQGTVVTNFHVVEQSPICPHDRIGVAISETSQSAPTLTYEADLLAFDTDLDLAVIRIARDLSGNPTSDTFTPLEIGDSDQVGLGDELRVIGYPGIGGETVTFTTGSVSGFAETPEGGERSWIKTDATITGGNSGGLAADEQGRFVGIPTRIGTGDGEIVDCRVIADSNGDGRLDNADSCVPIGGFINGIRPVALVLPLVAEADTAAPIDQSAPSREEPMSMVVAEAFNPIWTSAVTADGAPTDQIVAGTTGQSEICLTWDYANVPTGTPGDAIWLIDGETIPEASVFDQPNQGEDTGSFFACITSTNGLASGVYELAWLVDGELVFTEGIIVGDGSSILIDVVNEHDVPLCVVQFNPNGTATYGLNELSEPLQPGDFVTLEIGAGLLDARVLDCDGVVRLEDNQGAQVVEASTLPID